MTSVTDELASDLFDIQAELTKQAVNEVNKLRRRVLELEAQIAAQPATAWELQERITQLELLLKAEKT